MFLFGKPVIEKRAKRGQITCLNLFSRYGVIVDVFNIGLETWYAVHYIDPDTGELMECPDKARCGHSNACPIHGKNIRARDLEVFDEDIIKSYVDAGMLSKKLAKAAV